MALTLPPANYITEDVRVVSSRNDLRSANGSNHQRIARKGSHYIGVFACEPQTQAEGRKWRRLETEDQTVVAQIEQPGIDVGAPGNNIRVAGAGQAGASINLDGMTPGYIVSEGQLLSHVSAAGMRRLYMAAETVVVGSGGAVTIPLRTMLTAPPADNDLVHLADIWIEGFPTIEEGSFLIDGDGYVHVRFTVEEPG